MTTFKVSELEALIVLWVVLIFFTFVVLGAARLLECLPSILTKYCIMSSDPNGQSGDGSKLFWTASGTDYLLSARNSVSAPSLALSYFASGMGAWVLYGTTEMGATPQLSWLGVIGYCVASSAPAILVCWLGPKIRGISTGHQAFSMTDFARQRYGRVIQSVVGIVSGFYMFISIVAKLTSIGNIFALANKQSYGGF
jgi:solute:Na+ symporter, SSS family